MSNMKEIFTKAQEVCDLCNNKPDCEGCEVVVEHNNHKVYLQPVDNSWQIKEVIPTSESKQIHTYVCMNKYI